MDLEQAPTRKILETFIEMPAVLYTLILKFVGPYEWSDLKHIPRDVMCTCMLDVNIIMHGTLTRWHKMELHRCDKVYVMRWKGKYGSLFTFNLTIDGKSYGLFCGIMETSDKIVFRTSLYAGVVFVPVVS